MLVTPHDTLFKVLFSRPRRAAEVLRQVLPPGVARRIDWSTLRSEPGSFIDEELRGSHADLLFSAQMDGETVEIYVLYEHQSTFDGWMPLRLLRYMVRIWEALRKARPESTSLPVIFPVVLHHGAAPWSGSTEFAGLFTAPAEAQPFVPQFRFVLDDLSAIGAAELQARTVSACVRLVLATLQAARTPESLAEVLRRLRGLVLEVMREPDEHDAVGAMIRYLFEVYGADEYDAAVQTLVEDIKERSETEMETIAQMLERRGREQGERDGQQKGRQKGQQDLLLRVLKARFGEVPPAVRARVEAAETTELQAWVDRLFTVGSIEALLDG